MSSGEGSKIIDSSNYFIRPREHVGRNCQPDLLRRLEVDDEFKLRWLLNRQIGRFSAFQDLVHIIGARLKLSGSLAA